MPYRNLIISIVVVACLGFIAYYAYDYYKIPDSPEGDRITQLELPDVNGQPLPLSTLKGKIVLIQFWAAWCGPCRYENPALVELYRTFYDGSFKSSNGFEIYSISLDVNRKYWITAIGQDQLIWKNHVSELKGWNSEVATQFGIRSIPANILIDEDGKIIGKNLSIPAIENYLEQRLAK